jgi:exo-beta-1,3-glucanase (GH17 family)
VAVAPHTGWIRTFDCTGDLPRADAFAHALGEKVAVGAWIGRDPFANQAAIDSLVAQAVHGDADMVIVGSEALLRGDVSKATLIGYIDQVKSRLVVAGVNIPVAMADVYSEFLTNPDLISRVDVVLANFYPFWEGSSVDTAIARLDRAYQRLVQLAGPKPVVVSETGWSAASEAVGEAVPSPGLAADYFTGFISWARTKNVDYFYFEAGDAAWKAVEEGVGPHWGVFDAGGTLKPGMERVFNGESLPDNWTAPSSGVPIIDFTALPMRTGVNIGFPVVVDVATPGSVVTFDGSPIPAGSIDAGGVYAFTVPLTIGSNTLELAIQPPIDVPTTVTKPVDYDPTLRYVDAVAGLSTEPSLEGTVVLDEGTNAVLGLLPGRHVRGISPSVSPSLPAPVYGQPLAFTAIVATTIGGPVPLGTVQSAVDGANLGSADFGLTKRVERECELTKTGTIVGTPSYVSPEHVFDKWGAADPTLSCRLAGFVYGDFNDVGSYPITISAGPLPAPNEDFPDLVGGSLTVTPVPTVVVVVRVGYISPVTLTGPLGPYPIVVGTLAGARAPLIGIGGDGKSWLVGEGAPRLTYSVATLSEQATLTTTATAFSQTARPPSTPPPTHHTAFVLGEDARSIGKIDQAEPQGRGQPVGRPLAGRPAGQPGTAELRAGPACCLRACRRAPRRRRYPRRPTPNLTRWPEI